MEKGFNAFRRKLVERYDGRWKNELSTRQSQAKVKVLKTLKLRQFLDQEGP